MNFFLHTNSVSSHSNVATLLLKHFVLTELIFVITDKNHVW